MKNPLIALITAGLLLSVNAAELKSAKSIQNITLKIENTSIAKIKKDKKAQKIIKELVHKASKQIENEAKKGFKIGVALDIHYGNSKQLLRDIGKYPSAEKTAIYMEFYKILEKKGFTVKDKTYSGSITSTKVYW